MTTLDQSIPTEILFPRGCELFSNLSMADLLSLQSAGSIRTYQLHTGEHIGLVNRSGDDLLVLLHGRVVASDASDTRTELDSETSVCQIMHLPGQGVLEVRAERDAQVCRVDRDQLDYLIGWNVMLDALEMESEELRFRLEKIKRPVVFQHLSLANVETALKRMTRREVTAGEEIMHQGDLADNFYIIESGAAEVWEQGAYDNEPQLVNELGPGDHFGDDALVMGGTRSATVRVVEAGVLLVLTGEDFQELIHQPLVQQVDVETAKSMIDRGACEVLDVRYEEEWEDARLPNVTLVPLHQLRKRLGELQKGTRYLTYCLSGKRSAVAAMILSQRGYDAVAMDGGLRDWPYETESSY